jgi:fatty-acyl-CoA synthase
VITDDLLWPPAADPSDLAAIEAVPLARRGLPDTTYALLRRAAGIWPDRTAVSVLPDAARWEHPLRRSFSGLLADVHRAANLLHDLGVRRGNAVALLSPNCDELITATLAAQLAGIAAPVNGGLSGEHIAELLRRSGARIVIAAAPGFDQSSWDSAAQLARDGVVDTILLLRPTGQDTTEAAPAVDGVVTGYLGELAAGYRGDTFAGTPPVAEDLAALFHTGGTTGTPKLAAHTHANEVADAWMIGASGVFDEDSTLFAALPLFHVNALVVTLLAALFRGQHVVWAGPLGYRDPALYPNFWKMVARYQIATMSGVPTVYAALAQCPVDADISSLRLAVVGASPLPESVRRDFESHTGIALVEGYGLTEATCASARSFADHPRAGSVGQRLPYQRVKTVRVGDDGSWTDLPAGEVGNLVISGPTVFAGYVIDRSAAGYVLDGLGKLVDGWLDTGDLARVDDDGFIHLTGRAKDLIIRGGHNIDPAVVEDALLAHPDVTGAAAVGRPDTHSGEVPVAYVTVRPGATVTGDELNVWAGEQVTERAAAPKAVTIVDALPVTAVGKPFKLPLRADATEVAAREALAAIVGVESVDAHIRDGGASVTVVVGSHADEVAVQDILGRFSFPYTVVEH